MTSFVSNFGIKRDVFVHFGGRNISVLTLLFYVAEWSIYIVALVLSQIYRRILHPRFADFSVFDSSISHMYFANNQTLFPNLLLVFCTIGVSILTTSGLNIFSTDFSATRKLWNTHSSILTVLGSNALQSSIVSLLKNITGSPRPDLLSRCQPNPDLVQGHMIDITMCSPESLPKLIDGFRSFPSGTASTAFANLTVVVFMILSRVDIVTNATSSNSMTLPMVTWPIFLAILISASSLSDNRHFLTDSIMGALIGTISSLIIYRQYFPTVWSFGGTVNSLQQTSTDPTRAYSPKRFCCSKAKSWDVDSSDDKEPNDVTSKNNLPALPFHPESQTSVNATSTNSRRSRNSNNNHTSSV